MQNFLYYSTFLPTILYWLQYDNYWCDTTQYVTVLNRPVRYVSPRTNLMNNYILDFIPFVHMTVTPAINIPKIKYLGFIID